MLDKPVNKKTLILGEIGLGGEIRPISKSSQRLKEAEKLGFKTVLGPGQIKNLNDLISKLF